LEDVKKNLYQHEEVKEIFTMAEIDKACGNTWQIQGLIYPAMGVRQSAISILFPLRKR